MTIIYIYRRGITPYPMINVNDNLVLLGIHSKASTINHTLYVIANYIWTCMSRAL